MVASNCRKQFVFFLFKILQQIAGCSWSAGNYTSSGFDRRPFSSIVALEQDLVSKGVNLTLQSRFCAHFSIPHLTMLWNSDQWIPCASFLLWMCVSLAHLLHKAGPQWIVWASVLGLRYCVRRCDSPAILPECVPLSQCLRFTLCYVCEEGWRQIGYWKSTRFRAAVQSSIVWCVFVHPNASGVLTRSSCVCFGRMSALHYSRNFTSFPLTVS